MRLIQKNEWKEIISGANLLGTGGGGTIAGASAVIKKIIDSVKLVSLKHLDEDSLVCTVFGVGGKQNCDPILASRKSLELFQGAIKQKISAVIPVEVGPMAIANATFLASELKIPMLDSDIVGLRSSPEVFLETISIPNLSRTPCAIADDKGNSAVLWESQGFQQFEQFEQFLRNFTISAGGDAFVAGYPLKVSALKEIVPEGSITLSQKTGKALKKLKANKIDLKEFCKKTKWALLGMGTIIKQIKNDLKGFSEGEYKIKSGKNNSSILFKNENLIFLKKNKVILTCPDSISLLSLETFEGINNFENNENKSVAILGKKAIPIWRTQKGKKLFSPKNLGFDCKQLLLK